MPTKANQLPKSGKVKTPPPKRNGLPLRLALTIVAGGAGCSRAVARQMKRIVPSDKCQD